ncbi:Ribosomal RNA small subunit methyltransferase D [Botrimarina colliarenosi]|uniref:Ribosomal RNA small subunit methyltransferase D n=1 Tax=Botrimarina colliarenosi TaxID=2528001 RepID=A0A5C6ALL0_9BACT|nr:RsmD family RNA methyltransferase [Botrimarina colliarenosi]TWU00149.1 Ribosomal RNA small subunit methyltransferase D [Botrimarina colliarenosi]
MPKRRKQSDTPTEAVDLRIIGGRYRGTKLTCEPLLHSTGKATGERVTRPMKHRVREAIFNLVGTHAEGKHAIDVFAGTGALGLEALSRGATSCLFIERHVPTAAVVKQNIAAVKVESSCELLIASAFVWAQRDLPSGGGAAGAADPATPWLAFVSPPYAFFIDRQEEMLMLISGLLKHAPPESMLIVEADERFDFSLLPGGDVKAHRSEVGWDVREYRPAVVGVLHTGASGE